MKAGNLVVPLSKDDKSDYFFYNFINNITRGSRAAIKDTGPDDEVMTIWVVFSGGNHWTLLMHIGDHFYWYNSLGSMEMYPEQKTVALFQMAHYNHASHSGLPD